MPVNLVRFDVGIHTIDVSAKQVTLKATNRHSSTNATLKFNNSGLCEPMPPQIGYIA